MRPSLFLADLAGKTAGQVLAHIVHDWEVTESELAGFKILVAYESVGDYGCDSEAYFLLQKADGSLFEVTGSHCSCNGFEGQWAPKPTTVAYLTGPSFQFSSGGYDGERYGRRDEVRDFLRALFVPKVGV